MGQSDPVMKSSGGGGDPEGAAPSPRARKSARPRRRFTRRAGDSVKGFIDLWDRIRDDFRIIKDLYFFIFLHNEDSFYSTGHPKSRAVSVVRLTIYWIVCDEIKVLDLLLKMLAMMEQTPDSNHDPVQDFLTSGRTGRRNAMPDILGEHAATSTAELPACIQKLSTTDASASSSNNTSQSSGVTPTTPNTSAALPTESGGAQGAPSGEELVYLIRGETQLSSGSLQFTNNHIGSLSPSPLGSLRLVLSSPSSDTSEARCDLTNCINVMYFFHQRYFWNEGPIAATM
uniref:Uncharacterized protein n=1 Tax=Timema douglasi TaxID=61478 RepID=A0A7R8VNC1_TIMDO|nr:unnamed protein product [Timema douglasi]